MRTYTPAAQSMIAGRPDVLRCSENNHLFYLNDDMRYQLMDVRSNEYLTFYDDGSFFHDVGRRSKNYLCYDKSLQELVQMGLAYNVLSAVGPDTDADQDGFTTSIKPGVPDAIMCDQGKMFYRTSPHTDVFYSLDNAFYSQYLTYDDETGENIVDENMGSQVWSCEYKSIGAVYAEGRGMNFVTSSQADAGGFTSVLAGWPDAIACGGTVYYLSHDEGQDDRYYASPLSYPSFTYSWWEEDPINGVRFSIANQQAVQVPSDSAASSCMGKTVADLYADGLAYNFISGVGTTRYFFEYTLENHVFEHVNITQVPTDTVISQGGGKLTNCANGAAIMERSVSLAIANEQEIAFSKSFTSTATASVAAGYSVSTSAAAHDIFRSSSVAAAAGLEMTETFSASASRTDSISWTTTSTIEFELTTSVEVKPQECSEYKLATQVSSVPVRIPFAALARLVVYDYDTWTGTRGGQVTDLTKLQYILGLLNEDPAENYQALLDSTGSTIVFGVEGVYTGKYATNSETLVRECDLICDADDPNYGGGPVNFAAAQAGVSATSAHQETAQWILGSIVLVSWLILCLDY